MLKNLSPALAALALLVACQAPRPLPPEPALVTGRWSEVALDDLEAAASGAPKHGLPSQTPALQEIEMLRASARTSAAARESLDDLADDVLSRLAQTYAAGLVDPALDPAWHIPRAAGADTEAILTARMTGESSSALLQSLLPRDPQYAALVAELARVSGEADGAADAEGRSREQRLSSLRVSLERWRWLPRDLGDRRIEVRIPQFEAVYRAPSVVDRHRIIVGARASQTPSFVASMEAVTINPTWTVPRSILSNELLPRFRRDPSAAARESYDVIDSRGQVVAPESVDWNARPFPYVLRQRAGAANALGRLKFEMPNPYDAYLHDTPNRRLFERQDRALSHGCIRVEGPLGLAATILAPAWTEASLQTAIDEGATTRIPLATPLPVYALYITAAANPDGAVTYASDIYQRDAAILAALNAPDAAYAASRSVAGATECSG